MGKRKATTWLEVAVARVGLRDGIRAMTWAYQWAVVREALGRDPSAEEVAEWWAGSERTTYREKAAFHKAFPELTDPDPLYHSPEAREALEQHAELGRKMDEWGERRRQRKETSILTIGMGTARLP